MTIAELLVLNSTLSTGTGTVFENLISPALTRNIFESISVDVTDNIKADVSSGIITGNVSTTVITADIVDTTAANIGTTKLGVNV